MLRRAVRQMCLNWESQRGWDRKHFWVGRTLKMINNVWPHFRLDWSEGSLTLSGVPAMRTRPVLSKAFLEDATRQQWQRRQAKILCSAMTPHQQNFILKTILRRACSDQQRQILDNGQRANISPLSEVIFSELPKADNGSRAGIIVYIIRTRRFC